MNEHLIQNKVTTILNFDDCGIPLTVRNTARAVNDQGLALRHGEQSTWLPVCCQSNIRDVIAIKGLRPFIRQCIYRLAVHGAYRLHRRQLRRQCGDEGAWDE